MLSKGIRYLVLVCVIISCIVAVSLDDDPNLWPGHLEPFGAKQNTVDIEVFREWPSPEDFFKNFLDRSRPALFKGLAKRSPAYKLWDDEYLENHPGADEIVYVEPEKKENRTKIGKNIKFKTFIQTYKKESIYMVNGVPVGLQKDVVLPAPLRCDDSRKYMLDAVTWFSSGGTKSVIHNDDVDNINCLFRGSKELFFVEFERNGQFVPLGNNGGYASIDVEKVDYTKFPQLRRIDKYTRAVMEEGDCLFIPFQWIHQVNSFANEKGQNVAVNIWFKHSQNHRPKKCDIPELEATINRYKFSDLERQKPRYGTEQQTDGTEQQTDGTEQPNGTEETIKEENTMQQEEEPILMELYEGYLKRTKRGRANFKTFYSILKRDPNLTKRDISAVEFPESFEKIVKELFQVLDFTQNGVLNVIDFDEAEKQENRTAYEKALVETHEKMLRYLDGFLIAQSEGRSVEEFENNFFAEEEKVYRISDEL